ncbi:MAG TPA: flagellar filament capping protein FliD [Rhodocyclaceae bacterium]|nr:flagellar filament capping protein FliD [Rhodocyclaceae bacterium]
MAVASSSAVLDVPSLVSQLMTVERKPIDKLNTKVSDYQAKISSFGTLSGLVSGFQSALKDLQSNLQGYSATASDASVFSATAASTSTAGTYSLVVTHLAQAQNLVATGQASDTNAISSAASTITFTINGTGTDVTIPANATLQDIRTAINSANLGVTATVINDGSTTPYRLALTANATGLSNGFTIATDNADPAIDGLLTTMTQTVAAQNAEFTVNGISITNPSNNVSGAIQGVTLTLKNLTTTPANLTVARDTSSINTAASKVVDAYNALISQLKSRSAYGNPTTPAGALAGDGTVRQMLDQLRGILSTPASGGTLSYLSQAGISIQVDSSLKLDSSKLNNAIADNFSDVTNLFSSATGFATRLDAWATSAVQAGGLIDSRTKSLNNSVKGYNDQISKLEVRMTALQKQYTTTYTNLNMMLANMNATSTYLTQQFSKNTTS